MRDAPRVDILLAAHEGARFLPAQLDSILAQDHRAWSLTVSDDGSRDDTAALVEAFAHRAGAGRVRLVRGPGRGATANFLSLLAGWDGGADFVALADQDDVWFPAKLGAAIRALGPCGGLALYGARTVVTDALLRPYALSPCPHRPLGFRNALVQNVAGGNTMVLPAAAAGLAAAAARRLRTAGVEPAAHDWWLYQLVSGAGGAVLHDPVPRLLYRQHGANLVGANAGWRARMVRARGLVAGRFAAWNRQNRLALAALRDLLSAEARAALDGFCALADLSGWPALRALDRAGLYRQTHAGDLSLRLAAWLGRV
ncbi:MAG: glycosyltransferase [Rhodobacteraceae bacterium]|nr:glycosyltransferase [Paracoccaceae bacterium]